MNKAVLFDLDGTLWDSSEQVITAWNQCIRERTPYTEQFTTADMQGFMGKTMEAIAALMFPKLSKEEQTRILRMCTDEEYAYLEEHAAPLYPHVREVLTALSKEYRLAIVSNCLDGYIQIFLKQCGFSEIFSDFESAGKTGLGKGQNIRLVMERLQTEQCIYVGDTQGDANAAAEAGVPFIHAGYGFGTVENCAAVIHSLTELPHAVQTVMASR
ncbi:MAG: HAD family hydrolase [Oscillospiraceae bacterium]|nr:HAD family hydrolase [Oscillospiraceae bacterium]